MDYKLTSLKSGLRVLTVPMPSLESVTVTVWVKTGSRFEEKRVNGISHFLEHMVFKGSKKRPSAKAISEAVDSIGGEFNAATSKDWTNFYIKSRSASIETAMDVLSDMVLNPLIKAEEIEREKGTILQEIAMYEDTPMMHIGDVFEELVFAGNPLGWDTTGDAKSVKAIKRADFLKYRALHYHPEEMMVSVVGGITDVKARDLVEKYFGKIPNFKGLSFKAEYFKGKDFKFEQTKPRFKLQTKKVEQVHMILGFNAQGRGYKDRFAQMVLSAILGAGMSSRLFIEVRERRGLAYGVRTSVDRYQDAGYLGTYAGVDLKRADQAVEVILDQIYGLADGKYPVGKKELSKAKEFIKGHIALALEDTKDVSAFFGEQVLFLPNEILTPEEVYKKIDKVTVKDIMTEAEKLFVPGGLNLAVIGPFKDAAKFRKLLR